MVHRSAVFIGKCWLIGLMLMLGGCLGTMGGKAGGDVPAWILNPTPDTPDAMYGIGEGRDLETAKRAALKDVAGKLRVTISGTMQSQLSVQNEQVNRSTIDRISEEIQKTEFSHFEVIKVANTNQGVAALVQIDRQAFIRDTEDKLNALDKDIKAGTQDLDRQAPLDQFLALRSVQGKLLSARGLCQILAGARVGGYRDPRLARFEALSGQADRAAQNLVFEIRNKPEDQDLATVLAGLLHDSGVRVAPRVDASGVVLDVSSTKRSDFIQGSSLVSMQVTLTTQDGKGRTVASKRHDLNGASVTDMQAARLNALRKWTDQLKTAGLSNSLGLSKP